MNTITPIFDGHNDTLPRLIREAGFDFLAENESGHLDLPRARRGGLAGGIFAIYTPPPEGSPERAWDWELVIDESGYRQAMHSAVDPAWAEEYTAQVLAALDALLDRADGQVRLATTAAEIEQCIAGGVLALVMHMEGAEAIRADLSNLEAYYARGLRSLGLVWSRPNAFAHGVPFAYPAGPDTGPGLKDAGRELVRACNRLGIVVDLAHINERGFWDAAEISSAPLVVSHADAHALLPSTRNLTAAQIDAIGASGGLGGLNFEPMQIGEGGRPMQDVPLANLVRHVDFIAGRVGIDHVALGSDFDGTDMPTALRDAAGLQNIIQALREAGYDQGAVEKVAYRNWLRVLRATWGG
jgi:membrane dipeptidase